ncbi:MAG TPA: hypothetical protein VGN16_20140 [Acidobacteriaceae bacterium]
MTIALPFFSARRALTLFPLLFCLTGRTFARAQTPAALTSGEPITWIETAATNELRIIDEDGTFGVRFLARKVDARGDVTRDTIESRDGAVARLIQRDGKPITAEEDAAERQRLEGMLNAPADFLKKHKRNSSARDYTSRLVRQMPKAMIYSYAPGQPQPPGATSPQVVIDFKPDPKYKAPDMICGLLTGIEGRLWIDARTKTLTRGETRVSQPVDFGWGMLARIYSGGTVEFEQTPIGDGHWIYSRVEEHLRIREVMVKVLTENSTITTSNVQLLPGTLSWQEAIHKLLDTPLPGH